MLTPKYATCVEQQFHISLLALRSPFQALVNLVHMKSFSLGRLTEQLQVQTGPSVLEQVQHTKEIKIY